MYKYAWCIILGVAVLLFVIALIGYTLTSNQNDAPLWIWVTASISFILVIASFIVFGIETSRGPIMYRTLVFKTVPASDSQSVIPQFPDTIA